MFDTLSIIIVLIVVIVLFACDYCRLPLFAALSVCMYVCVCVFHVSMVLLSFGAVVPLACVGVVTVLQCRADCRSDHSYGSLQEGPQVPRVTGRCSL